MVKQEDFIEQDAFVEATCPNMDFVVKLVINDKRIKVRASGKIKKKKHIKILPGDKVKVRLSVGCKELRGIIVYRYSKQDRHESKIIDKKAK